MKVRIYQNQIVPENADLYVLSPTGDYGPFDLIQCFKKDNRTFACCALQAQFIKFGGVVYREDEYIDVLGRLGLVDLKPETLNDMLTGDKTSIVVDKDPLANLPDVTFAEEPAVPLPNQSIIDNNATTTEPVATSTSSSLPSQSQTPIETSPVAPHAPIETGPIASSTDSGFFTDATSTPVVPEAPLLPSIPDATTTPPVLDVPILEVPSLPVIPEATSTPVIPVETVLDAIATSTADISTPVTVSSSTETVVIETIQ